MILIPILLIPRKKHLLVVQGDNSNKLSTFGFRVNDETKAMLQDYANRLSQEYLMVDISSPSSFYP
jgi:hypothetical protein